MCLGLWNPRRWLSHFSLHDGELPQFGSPIRPSPAMGTRDPCCPTPTPPTAKQCHDSRLLHAYAPFSFCVLCYPVSICFSLSCHPPIHPPSLPLSSRPQRQTRTNNAAGLHAAAPAAAPGDAAAAAAPVPRDAPPPPGLVDAFLPAAAAPGRQHDAPGNAASAAAGIRGRRRVRAAAHGPATHDARQDGARHGDAADGNAAGGRRSRDEGRKAGRG